MTIESNINPWLTPNTLSFLNTYLTRDMLVFEWGSGDSTLYISSKVKEIITVEHDFSWYMDMNAKVALNNISNITIKYFPGEEQQTREYLIENYASKNSRYKRLNFRNYVTEINRYDQKYDLILIDGRSRLSCAYHALSKIKNNGYIILDNSDRNHYKPIHELLKEHESFDLSGKWGVTAWKIKK